MPLHETQIHAYTAHTRSYGHMQMEWSHVHSSSSCHLLARQHTVLCFRRLRRDAAKYLEQHLTVKCMSSCVFECACVHMMRACLWCACFWLQRCISKTFWFHTDDILLACSSILKQQLNQENGKSQGIPQSACNESDWRETSTGATFLIFLSTQSTSQGVTKLKNPSYQPASTPSCAVLLHHTIRWI